MLICCEPNRYFASNQLIEESTFNGISSESIEPLSLGYVSFIKEVLVGKVPAFDSCQHSYITLA